MTITEAVVKVIYKDDPAGASKLKASLDQIQKGVEKARKGLDHISGGLKPLGIAITGAFGGLSVGFNKFLSTGDEIAKMSRDIGINSDAWQELTYTAGLSGMSTEKMAKNLKRLSKSIEENQLGAKGASPIFKELGIAVNNADGSARSFDDILYDLSDAMVRVPDEARRSAIAMEFFGQKNARMGQYLGQGSGALREQRKEAHELGGVLSKETLTIIEKLSDDFGKLKTIVWGLFAGAMEKLVPIVFEIVNQFKDWAKTNAQIIRTRFGNFLTGLISAFRKILPVVQLFLQYWDYIAVAFLAFNTAKIVAGIASIVAGLWTMVTAQGALNIAMLMNPIGFFIAGFTAIAVIFYGLEKRFGIFSKRWKSLIGWIKDAGKWVKELGQVIWDWLVTAWQGFMDKVTTLWNASALKLIIDLFRDPSTAFAKWGEGLKNVYDKFMPNWAKNEISAVRDFFTPTVPTASTYVPESYRTGGGGFTMHNTSTTTYGSTFAPTINFKTENPKALDAGLKTAELRAYRGM